MIATVATIHLKIRNMISYQVKIWMIVLLRYKNKLRRMRYMTIIVNMKMYRIQMRRNFKKNHLKN